MSEYDQDGRSPGQEFLDEMTRKRGYALEYHKYLVNADYDVMKATNELVQAVYLEERSLDRRTKELLFILSLTVLRAGRKHIQSHIKVALELGVTPQEILEAIEIALPEAGVVVFQEGFEAWCEAVGATPLEPTPVHASSEQT